MFSWFMDMLTLLSLLPLPSDSRRLMVTSETFLLGSLSGMDCNKEALLLVLKSKSTSFVVFISPLSEFELYFPGEGNSCAVTYSLISVEFSSLYIPVLVLMILCLEGESLNVDEKVDKDALLATALSLSNLRSLKPVSSALVGLKFKSSDSCEISSSSFASAFVSFQMEHMESKC